MMHPVTLIVESNSVDKKRGLYNPSFYTLLYVLFIYHTINLKGNKRKRRCSMLQEFNIALRFMLELCILGIVGYWGFE